MSENKKLQLPMNIYNIQKSIFIAAPIEKVFQAITSSERWDKYFTTGMELDPRLGALVALAGEIAFSKGWPAQELVDNFFAAGYNKAALVELIGLVSLNVFKNYLNDVADSPLDFPEARQLKQEAVS